MPKQGQYTKSDYLIWDQIVHGTRWNLRVYCRGCLDGLQLEPDEQPYVPKAGDLTYYCQSEASLVDVAKLYAEPVDSLAFLDAVDNVPTEDKKEVEQWVIQTVDCPMPGPSHQPFAVWIRV